MGWEDCGTDCRGFVIPLRFHSRESGNLLVGIASMINTSVSFYVYILASKKNGVLYIGVTNDINRRVLEHKKKLVKGFSSRYNVDKLVYLEAFLYVKEAIQREKQLKKWNRDWKTELIENDNPEWNDLAEGW